MKLYALILTTFLIAGVGSGLGSYFGSKETPKTIIKKVETCKGIPFKKFSTLYERRGSKVRNGIEFIYKMNSQSKASYPCVLAGTRACRIDNGKCAFKCAFWDGWYEIKEKNSIPPKVPALPLTPPVGG